MIEFVKQVEFRDCNGFLLCVYNIGDKIPFTAKREFPPSKDGYYVTSMGGIWFDEASEVK